MKASKETARKDVGTRKQERSPPQKHPGEPQGVDEGDVLEKSGSLASNNQVQSPKTKGREHERHAEAAQQIVHAARGACEVEVVGAHQGEQLFLGVVGGL